MWFPSLGLRGAAVLCIHPTPSGSFAVLASSACLAYSAFHDWSSSKTKNPQGLTGCLDDTMCSANGPWTPGLRQPLAVDATADIAFQHLYALGRFQKIRHFGAQYHSGRDATPYLSSSLPFCVRFNAPVTRNAATLDTGPLARSYPGGNPTRLSPNHFQFAHRNRVRGCGGIRAADARRATRRRRRPRRLPSRPDASVRASSVL